MYEGEVTELTPEEMETEGGGYGKVRMLALHDQLPVSCFHGSCLALMDSGWCIDLVVPSCGSRCLRSTRIWVCTASC